MSTEAVKRQILIAIDALSIPLNRVPSQKAIFEACSAAKLLRNRLLREHTRVMERIETLRERQMFDEVSDEDTDYDRNDEEKPAVGSGVSRTEFVFVCEMMVAEKLVIPLLMAHGMSFSDSLLPQLLKLLAVMLLPVPRYSADELLQKDLLQRVKTRCGTDEFFALLVQCVAPIAEKRTSGELQRGDVVILEIILTLTTYLLDGSPADAERIIGAFCRNHGIELLLVVINQNYARTQETASGGAAPPKVENRESGADEEVKVSSAPADASGSEKRAAETDEINLESEEDEVDLEGGSASSSLSQLPDTLNNALELEYRQEVHNLLESEEQLWKWNCLALASIASVIRCVPSEELAQLTLLGHSNASTPEQLLNALRGGQQLRECKKNNEKWRFVARSRNGSVTSTGILVRGGSGGANSGRAIGSVSALLGSRRKDPLEVMKDIDLQKRGRFIKGMFQGSAPQCNLPLPTKIQLSQQNSSFLCFGFEPLTAMTFGRLQEIALNVERATKEHKEALSGYRGSGEVLEVSSPIDATLYENLSYVLHYMCICRCTLRYIRVTIEQLKTEQVPFLAMFPQQWQSISSVISLDFLELGFSVLRSFLDCRDIRCREDVTNVVGYLSEILLILNLLLQGDIAADPAVEVAAHALASSVLYREDNIKAVFGLLAEYSSRVIAIRKAQQFTLFTFAVFQLMEKCSYKGNLLLPKRPKRQKDRDNVTAGEATEAGGAEQQQDDNESIDSATLEEMHEEMLQDMADMIDDTDADDHRSKRPTKSEGVKSEGDMVEKGDGDILTNATPVAATGEGEPPLAEPVFEPIENVGAVDDEEAAGSERAVSEGCPPSLASSGRTVLSTISSEREVSVGGYFRRLGTPKNISLVYSALRHWRINDADINLALTFLIDGLVRNDCECVFFNVAFLLLMREVLTHGEKTHGPLYVVCDKVVHDFFNPPFAKTLDERAATLLPDEVTGGMLSGAQSHLGFEVSLRCTRALFNFSATDYAYLEEKGMPHLMSYTVIPLPSETSGDGTHHGETEPVAADLTATPGAADPAAKASRRKSRKAARVELDSELEAEALGSESESEATIAEEEGRSDALRRPLGEEEGNKQNMKGKKTRPKSEKSHSHHHGNKKRRHENGESTATATATAAAATAAIAVSTAETNHDAHNHDLGDMLLGMTEDDEEVMAAAVERVAGAAPDCGAMNETLVIEEAV